MGRGLEPPLGAPPQPCPVHGAAPESRAGDTSVLPSREPSRDSSVVISSGKDGSFGEEVIVMNWSCELFVLLPVASISLKIQGLFVGKAFSSSYLDFLNFSCFDIHISHMLA